MSTVTISDNLMAAIERLEPGDDLDAKIRRLVESEIRRRLARYELSDRLFRQKYGMTLAEFEANDMLKKLGYSFEAESDYQDWDLAVDGIETLRRQLADLRG